MKKTSSRVLERGILAITHIKEEKIDHFRVEIERWYKQYGRRYPWREPSVSPFHLVLAELLLQRTRAEIVAKVYPTLIVRLNSWADILNIEIDELDQLVKPLGLHRQRVKALKALSKNIVDREEVIPASRSELEEMPGVGQYIASAILVSIHKVPEPLLDANMARVLERFFGPRIYADIRDDPYLQGLSRKILLHTCALEFNWAILDFATLICKSQKPLCHQCPLKSNCNWVQQNATQ